MSQLADTIKKDLNKSLDKKRYEHTIGVAYTAVALAMCYKMDLETAYLAGLLHDCAKCMPNEEKLEYCFENDIPVSVYEKKNPALLHGKIGSHIAAKKYHIKDFDILNAISYHTTGRPNMSMLEKIVYIADYIEPLREHDSDLPIIRSLAFTDINEAMALILKNTLKHLSDSNKQTDPLTSQTYDFYISERNQ